MFKNSVLKPSVNTLEWLKAAGIRAIKTFAQTAVSMITIGAAVSELDWAYIASVSAVALIYSVLTSIAGIPEVKGED